MTRKDEKCIVEVLGQETGICRPWNILFSCEKKKEEFHQLTPAPF